MNRKKRGVSRAASKVLNQIIGYSLLSVLFVGMYGLSTVYLRHQAANTANEIKAIESSISLQKRKNSQLGTELTRLTSRDSLKRLNRQYALGLAMPQDHQIVPVTENVEARLYRKTQNALLTASSNF